MRETLHEETAIRKKLHYFCYQIVLLFICVVKFSLRHCVKFSL